MADIEFDFEAAAQQARENRWMPPRADSEERRDCIETQGFDAFEQRYNCRVVESVARLWQDKQLHRRLVQGSDDWLDARFNYVTGSRVGDILQYNTSYAGAQRIDRFREYVKLDPPVQKTPAMEHGNRYEYCALYEFEEVMRLESHPVVSLPFNFLVCPTKPHYAYSPDGILNTGELVEIKCPERRVIVPGYIPPHYNQQMQYGLYCLDGFTQPYCYYIEYKPPFAADRQHMKQISIAKISRESDWAQRHVWLLDEFWNEVLEYRRTSVLPSQYTSNASFKVWWTARVQANPLLYAPSARSLKRQKEEAMEAEMAPEDPLYTARKEAAAVTGRKWGVPRPKQSAADAAASMDFS